MVHAESTLWDAIGGGTADETQLIQPPPYRQAAPFALDALLAPARQSPHDWAPANVFFPAVSSAVPRPYDFYMFPYHRGVWNAFMSAAVRFISMRWATQLGKTALMVAIVCYVAHQDPQPMIWGGPVESLLERTFGAKIYPVLRESPATGRLLPPEKLQRKLQIDLSDCMLYSAGSGSVSALGDISCSLILRNEVDKWSVQKSTEGDPVALIEERKKAFSRWKIISESTPSEEGASRIDRLIAESDQRTYRVPCPHCGVYQELIFERLVMPHDDDGRLAAPEICRAESVYRCGYCEQVIGDHQKLPAMRAGVWAPASVTDEQLTERVGDCDDDDPAREVCGFETEHAGFSLSSLYSQQITFGEMAAEWSRRQGNVGQIRAFVNGWLGRSFAPKTRMTTEDRILSYRGIDEGLNYPRDTCPMFPRTCWMVVDVQEDCLYYQVWAWCSGRRRYLLRYGQLTGDLTAAAQLAQSLVFESLTPSDQGHRQFKISKRFIDSGYRTNEVYTFCRKYGFVPIKGVDSDSRFTGSPIKWTKLSEYRGWLLTVRVHTFKDELAEILDAGRLDEPGCWRLFETCGIDFARQLTAEQRVTETDKNGQVRHRWVRRRAENHHLDLAVYNEAVAVMAEMAGFSFAEPSGIAAGPPAAERQTEEGMAPGPQGAES